MKKSWLKKIFSILLCVALLFCGACEEEEESSIEQECVHEWVEATCEKVKFCKKCQVKEGSALGHDWMEATCTSPKKCSRCNKTSGIHNSHEGGTATCSQRAVCENCKQEYGFKLEHAFHEGVCLECEYQRIPTDVDYYFDFTLLDDGSYSIKAKNKENLPKKVVIPESYNGEPVTKIERRGFAGCVDVEEIDIPTTVTQIEEEAFLNCPSLIEIALPEGVSEIKKNTFLYCISLKRIKLPSSLSYIANDAFFACYNLTETHLLDVSSWFNIEFASENANPIKKTRYLYHENQKITELAVPEGVVTVNKYSMMFSTIEKIEFEKSVCKIDDYAFAYCENLKEIAFKQYTSLVSIGSRAFYNCTNLETVDLSNAPILSEIQSDAFSWCDNIKRVYAYDLKSWLNIEFDSGSANPIHKDADLYVGGALLETLELPDDVTTVKDYAFFNCGSLKKLIFSKNTAELKSYAFAGCDLLTEIEFFKYGKLAIIGTYAFSGCDELLKVVIPTSVKYVGTYAFNDCAKLKSAIFESGGGITSLTNCFTKCPELEEVKLPNKLKHLNDSFEASNKLKKVVNNVAYVDNWAVWVVEKTTVIQFMSGTKGIAVSIPYYFADQIKKIYIPKSVNNISKGAFKYCSSAMFYCEAEKKPANWIDDWNPLNRPIAWGYSDNTSSSSSGAQVLQA